MAEPGAPHTPEDVETMKKYDLVSTHAKYLDGHMLIYLIQHIKKKELYKIEDMQEAEMEILQRTNMVDEILQKYIDYKGMTPEQIPQELHQQRDNLIKRIEELNTNCKDILENFGDGTSEEGWLTYVDLVEKVTDDKKCLFNLQYLEEAFGVTKEQFESLYSLAKIRYETGDYAAACTFLTYYRKIGELEHDADAKWGKFASELLVHDWPQALESLKVLQESIETTTMSTSVYQSDGAQLQARAWLMHWSLLLFFFQAEIDTTNSMQIPVDDGLDKLVESWLPNMGDLYKANTEKEQAKQTWKYLRVIQTICPHLLRYISAAVVIGSEETGKRASGVESGHIRMRQRFKDLAKLIENERRYYHDPITLFVQKLQLDCDLEGAQKVLHECELVMETDFFLAHHKARFVRQARKMIFESHCRIHSVMDIGMVAKKLNYNNAEAERYIVKMIRGAQLDARIDSEANQVLLASQGSSIYRTVREKTKLVRDKTDQLIERLQDRRPQQEEQEVETEDKKPSGPRSNMADFVRA